MPKPKKYYTPKEIVELGLLPYKSVITIRRLVRAGKIKVTRNPSPRSFIHIDEEEIARLQRGARAVRKTGAKPLKGVQNQDIASSPQFKHS